MPWKFLGKGSYNKAYINDKRTEVLKLRLHKEDYTDTPTRSVRVWNILNPELFPKARTEFYKGSLGWVSPFVEGRQSTDTEISKALLKIYTSSGRIVVDAISTKNFITTKSGKVVCIDIGLAIQLQKEAEKRVGHMVRRKSTVSLDAWDELKTDFEKYFKASYSYYEQSINTIKALLFMQFNRPDIVDASVLESDTALIAQLSKAYDNDLETRSALKSLELACSKMKALKKETKPDITQAIPYHIKKAKEQCCVHLNDYIKSRGLIEESGFKPTFHTSLFRNLELTTKKVFTAQRLISEIKRCSSIQDINMLFYKIDSDKELMAGCSKSGFSKSVSKCKQDIFLAIKLTLHSDIDEKRMARPAK